MAEEVQKTIPEINDQDGLFTFLIKKDDVTWQSMINDLVRNNQMDPWDIDVSLLTQKYIEMIQRLKELDFRVTGKVVLAAALLLKIKSNKLVGEEIDRLDGLFAQKDADDGFDLEGDDFVDEFNQMVQKAGGSADNIQLIPRSPAARRRKVSIYDLMGALQKAMEVKKRSVVRQLPPIEFVPPKRSRDITVIMREVYFKVKDWFGSGSTRRLTFNQLLQSNTREDKVFTFIPLLHLANQRKLNINQEEHFGDIEVELLKRNVKTVADAKS